AQEQDYDREVGRLFAAARIALPLERARLGYLTTWTDHPLLDRAALLNAAPFEITPDEFRRVLGELPRADIGSAGMHLRSLSPAEPYRNERRAHGYQAWLQIDANRSAPIAHTLKALYIDDAFDMNALGYMERNALKHLEWETNRRVAGG